MDTSIPSSSVLAYETLTALNSNEDTFEVFLLTLLRAHILITIGQYISFATSCFSFKLSFITNRTLLVFPVYLSGQEFAVRRYSSLKY